MKNRRLNQRRVSPRAGFAPAPAKWRGVACAALLFLVWGALWVRAGQVQLVRGPQLAQAAKRQHQAAELATGKRGDIVDRNGMALATSVRASAVFARPNQVENPGAAAAALAKVLGQSRRSLGAKLRTPRSFVWLARPVDDRTAAQVRELGLKGVGLKKTYSRVYPGGHLAGQLLGFAGVDGHGLEGLEKAFEPQLAPGQVRRTLTRDAAGRRLAGGEASGGVDGQNLALTLDAHVQGAAEAALARAVALHRGRWGGCLVVEVRSGNILAWAEYPFFNPNAYRGAAPRQWRNRLALDIFEPGSTLKPFLVAAALEAGAVTPDTRFDCEEGRWRLYDRTIRDTKPHGELSVAEVLSLSSNIGSAKLGLELGARAYHLALTGLGFGQTTRLPLSAQAKGLLRPANGWYRVDLANISFGQGLGVTGLQLAQAYLCLAADGQFRPLRLLKGAPPHAPVQVMGPAVARQVRQMLVTAVVDGTGAKGAIPGVVVGGKTGTAQKASPQGGYGDGYVSSFAALVPGDEPEWVVLVVVDEPKPEHYGGIVAAPVAREVAVQTMAYFNRLPQGQGGPLLAASGKASARGGVKVSGAGAVSDPTGLPDVRGLSLRQAVEALVHSGAVTAMPQVRGTGSVVVKATRDGAHNVVLTLGQGGRTS